jgi:hypothetical protein
MLRRPLPKSLPPRTAAFIAERTGPKGPRWLYLCPRPDEYAPFDAEAPVSAFILLRRRPAGDARLNPIDPSAILSEVIMQNLANKTAAHRVLDCMADVVGRAACYELVYSDTAEASRVAATAVAAGSR